ncbi:hypothetical protein Bbelb_076570 [Branchiostoma belcheri]|nr:hypothetical protein Bbelb_076570 [Branchiostoma belcheri]
MEPLLDASVRAPASVGWPLRARRSAKPKPAFSITSFILFISQRDLTYPYARGLSSSPQISPFSARFHEKPPCNPRPPPEARPLRRGALELRSTVREIAPNREHQST